MIRWIERHYIALTAALNALLVWLAYGYSLGMAFFYDDLPILTWLGAHGWADVWLRSENSYYRPLTFVIYKLGLVLPLGLRQLALHAVNLFWLWLAATLIVRLSLLLNGDRRQAAIAGVLLSTFPFLAKAIPWITAMGHPLALVLTLTAVYLALRAAREHRPLLWVLSLLSTALAPLAHESGVAAGAIVAALLLLQPPVERLLAPPADQRMALLWRRLLPAVASVLVGLAFIPLRTAVPDAAIGAARLNPTALLPKFLYFVQGLVYPLAPLVGWLVRHQGWHDLTLLGISAALLAGPFLWLARRRGDWRWPLYSLCWWACASLPAALTISFSGLYSAPRMFTLASVGAVLLWAGLLTAVADLLRSRWGQALLSTALTALIVIPGFVYIARERTLYTMLDDLYARLAALVMDETRAPVGFVNLPYSLYWMEPLYPLTQDGVVYVPTAYSNVSAYLWVNWQQSYDDPPRVADGDVFVETDPFLLVDGEWVDPVGLRLFALQQRSVWLSSLDENRRDLLLRDVGTVTRIAPSLADTPLVRYDAGPLLLSAAAEQVDADSWTLTLLWQAPSPAGGKIFVHLRDGNGELIAQADGPALGGLLPPRVWQPGDFLRDVRYVDLPPDAPPPYTVQVGLYNADGRFPAWMDGQRCPEDAAPVVTFAP